MNKEEVIGIVVFSAIGCLLLEAVGWLFGWTDSIGKAANEWLSLTFTTSVIAIGWTWWDYRRKKENKNK